MAAVPIQSTAGAVAVRNEKGQISMQKVKVNRYVSGKRPEYAVASSSEDESEDEEFILHGRGKQEDEDLPLNADVDEEHFSKLAAHDPRLRRLMRNEASSSRRIAKPEILESDSDDDYERPGRRRESESENEDEAPEEEDIERRRAALRLKALERREEEELLAKEDEKDSETEEGESEYEEYTDSEEEEARPRLKPVFVRRKDRITVKEKEMMDEIERQHDAEKDLKKEERRKETLKILEVEIRKERGYSKKEEEERPENRALKLSDIDTDDEDVDAEYEAWKLRELKRIKRDREEREAYEKEKFEIERIHSLTEEERRSEAKLKPKTIINKAVKGKYKFLQKYYHRGAFYLDQEEDVLKRDYSAPTLEDHHDKTILPKVMQVKNFGRSGRTKYTHLVDQDTTAFDSPWFSETPQNLKFHASQAGGVRQQFEKPSSKKRKLLPN